MFNRKSKIELMCRQTGRWAVIGFDNEDDFTVRRVGPLRVHPVTVLHHPKRSTTRFQCWLPCRFPLNDPPSGLFGRLLMRSFDLSWSSWIMTIGSSCEATACVTALVPSVALDARLFDEICREQTEEVEGVMRELREKFNWVRQGGSINPVAEVRQPGPGVPMLRPGTLPRRYP